MVLCSPKDRPLEPGCKTDFVVVAVVNVLFYGNMTEDPTEKLPTAQTGHSAKIMQFIKDCDWCSSLLLSSKFTIFKSDVLKQRNKQFQKKVSLTGCLVSPTD